MASKAILKRMAEALAQSEDYGIDPSTATMGQDIIDYGAGVLNESNQKVKAQNEALKEAVSNRYLQNIVKNPFQSDETGQTIANMGLESATMGAGKVYKVPMGKTGIDAKVVKNPTPDQAANIFNKSKGGTVRYFGDDAGNLHMWDAYDLAHGDLMEHLGEADYGGAGVVNSLKDAQDVAARFIKSGAEESKKVQSGYNYAGKNRVKKGDE